jgi:hypothetical protein
VYQVVIKRIRDSVIVESMPAANERIALAIERGVLINLNHEEYFVTIERGEEKR